MNVLLIGSGGREHALAWKLAASPLLTKLYAAPGNPGIAEEAECVPLDISDHQAAIHFCRENSIDLVVVGPEAPLVAGHRRRSARRRYPRVRAVEGGGPTRRLQGLHQRPVHQIRNSDCRLSPLHRPRFRQRLCARARRADRRQGRRHRRRQGRDRRDDCRRSVGGGGGRLSAAPSAARARKL